MIPADTRSPGLLLPTRIPGIFRFALIFTGIFLAHLKLLGIPYYWDEAGYYIPAARDFWLTHSLIPFSTITTSHTPLLSIYLAMWWKLSGYMPVTTRTAMLLVAAVGLSAVYKIARTISNREVAVAAVVCTAIYPIWFVQSSMAHADLLAATFTLWGLACYFRSVPETRTLLKNKDPEQAARRLRWIAVLFFSLSVLAKETAFVTPAALAFWELLVSRGKSWARSLQFVVPAAVLALWFGYQYLHTGFLLGDPSYLRYNAPALNPMRLGVALLQRLWHLLGHMNMFLLTAATVAAMTCPPRQIAGEPERKRIAIPIQLTILMVLLGHVVMYSVLGGALLTRYLLPAFPLVIIIGIATLWRRVAGWQLAVALIAGFFVAGLFYNPPYRFAMEDNLAYRDFVVLQKDAAIHIYKRFPNDQVLTAWPMTDELTRPWLGYMKTPVTVVPLENFSQDQIALAAQMPERYNLAVFFNTKYEPPHQLFTRFKFWEQAHERFFDAHTDLPPQLAAQMLGGKVVWQEERNGQWIAIAVFPRSESAALAKAPPVFSPAERSW